MTWSHPLNLYSLFKTVKCCMLILTIFWINLCVPGYFIHFELFINYFINRTVYKNQTNEVNIYYDKGFCIFSTIYVYLTITKIITIIIIHQKWLASNFIQIMESWNFFNNFLQELLNDFNNCRIRILDVTWFIQYSTKQHNFYVSLRYI